MAEAVIVLAAMAAAVYLLRPLFRGGGRRLLLLAPLLLGAYGVPAAQAATDTSIGLLLIAVDARQDHLRVSEAMRMVNAGPARELELTIALPPGAMYLTFHRGLRRPAAVADGFRDRLVLGRGVTEVIYSYALPARRDQAVTRTFPLRVERMEVVARGPDLRLTASRGQMVDALVIGGVRLPRWEARGLDAGESFMFTVRGVPVSRPWLPAAAAGLFALLLAGGFLAGAMARAPAARR